MEQSILTSTKKALNIAADDTSFDQDILTHINSAFSTLTEDLGVGPETGFVIDDASVEWGDFLDPTDKIQLPKAKTFVYLSVRLIFDPPDRPPVLSAFQEQLKEVTWRLNVKRESTAWVDPNPPKIVVSDDDIFGDSTQDIFLDGGEEG